MAAKAAPVSLKTPAALRRLRGLHIDSLLAKASTNGYAVNVLYGVGPLRSAGPKVLTVRLDDTNKVVSAR